MVPVAGLSDFGTSSQNERNSRRGVSGSLGGDCFPARRSGSRDGSSLSRGGWSSRAGVEPVGFSGCYGVAGPSAPINTGTTSFLPRFFSMGVGSGPPGVHRGGFRRATRGLRAALARWRRRVYGVRGIDARGAGSPRSRGEDALGQSIERVTGGSVAFRSIVADGRSGGGAVSRWWPGHGNGRRTRTRDLCSGDGVAAVSPARRCSGERRKGVGEGATAHPAEGGAERSSTGVGTPGPQNPPAPLRVLGAGAVFDRRRIRFSILGNHADPTGCEDSFFRSGLWWASSG